MLIVKGTFKHFKMDDVSVIHLGIGEKLKFLKVEDVNN